MTDWESKAREHIVRLRQEQPDQTRWIWVAQWLALALEEIEAMRRRQDQ